MKRLFPLGLFLLLLCSTISLPISFASEEQKEVGDIEYYALIVGVEKFSGIEYPEEDKIDDGIISVYNTLLESYNWEKENIKMLLNANATKNNIHDAIVNWLGSRENENDIVLIFYGDHGWKIPFYQRRYGHSTVFTYNVTTEQRLNDKITDKEFDSWIDNLESEHIVVILDTCYSGRMFSLREKGRVILAAGGKYLFCGVDEDDALESGIFSYFIRQSFTGIADVNDDGWVTAEESFRYARIPTIHYSIWKQFPFVYEYNNGTLVWFFQIPWMYDRHLGSIPLVQYRLSKE